MKTSAQLITKLYKHPSWVIALPVLLAIVLCVLPSLFTGYPKPVVYDEWGYLLSADTFDHGRLTNPTHPHWQHFETMHQLQVPSYQAKYPPAQGLMLALGAQIGHPIYGVWLSVALMIGAITWMLQSWFPPKWALIGGVLAALQLVVIGQPFSEGSYGYWSQSYWGGAIAAAGGALLLGAGRRLIVKPKLSVTFIFCIGAALLALSRPKEGLFLFLLISVVLAVWLVRLRGVELRAALQSFMLPAVGLGVALIVFIGIYNNAVTGNFKEIPWITHYNQYAVFPIKLWSEPRTDLEWRNPELEDFYNGWELDLYLRHTTVEGFIDANIRKIVRMWSFYIGPIFTIALLMLPWLLKKPWLLFAFMVVALKLANNLVTFAAFPHYSAPMAACFIVLLTAGLRYLRHVQWNDIKIGQYVVPLLFIAAIGQVAWTIPKIVEHQQTIANYHRHTFATQLYALPGKDLVLVRYGEQHSPHGEWVFNMADIDNSEVVWARELSPSQDAALREYFSDRKVWLVKVGFGQEPTLSLYSPGESALVKR